MKIIDVIGNIASGKSCVVDFLGTYLEDSKIIKLDDLGHEALNDKQVLFSLKNAFGEFRTKQELADIAFRDKQSTQKLNNITHRYIYNVYCKLLDDIKCRSYKYAIVEQTVFLGDDDPFIKLANIVLCVCTSYKAKLLHGINRGMDKEDFQRRISRQISQENMIKIADYVINNDGSLKDLEQKCKGFSLYLEKQ